MEITVSLPRPIDTTAWAKWQDSVFSSSEISPPPAGLEFDLMSQVQRKVLCVTNLTLRQLLIDAARAKGQIYGEVLLQDVKKEFDLLSRNGFWNEGPSYFEYVCTGLEWFFRVTGVHAVDPDLVHEIWKNYRAIAFPGGRLPLPEASAVSFFPDLHVDEMAETVNTAAYYVRRFFNKDRSAVTFQALISKDCNPDPRLNVHYHLSAGYVAVWSAGRFLQSCRPYTGFDWKKVWGDDGLEALLPWTALLPTWRASPPVITCDYTTDNTFIIAWKYPYLPTAKRTIKIEAPKLEASGLLTIKDQSAFIIRKNSAFLIN